LEVTVKENYYQKVKDITSGSSSSPPGKKAVHQLIIIIINITNC